MRLAYWVSSHGFGHAARACAVIEALCRRADERARHGQGPDGLEITIFAGTPRWFFEQSLGDRLGTRCTYRPWTTDVGMVQATAMVEDLDASVDRLSTFLPLSQERIDGAAEALVDVGAERVVADISPLGLAAARQLGLPSVLVENFTWDFIYRGYRDPRLEPFADAVAPLFDGADLRLRTEPHCPLPAGARPRQTTVELPPVARRRRLDPARTRAALGIGDADELVMVTMGGVPWEWAELDRQLEEHGFGSGDAGAEDLGKGSGKRRRWLLIAGGCDDDGTNGGMERRGSVILLAHRSPLYHPDLVAAADAVVAKLGYSTVAEVVVAGARLGYIPRPHFPESPALEAWVGRHLASRRLEVHELESGAWLGHLDALLAEPTLAPADNGDGLAAERVLAPFGAPSSS